MSDEEITAWALAFIDHFSTPYVWDKDMVLVKRDNAATSWASSKAIDLAHEDPDQLWGLILEVLRQDPATEVIEVLAAGPLEDYISQLGDSVIEKVEAQAAIDPKFRSLLGGVWRNGMSDDILSRGQACWDRSGWDGNA